MNSDDQVFVANRATRLSRSEQERQHDLVLDRWERELGLRRADLPPAIDIVIDTDMRREFWDRVVRPIVEHLEGRLGRALLTDEERERFRIEFQDGGRDAD